MRCMLELEHKLARYKEKEGDSGKRKKEEQTHLSMKQHETEIKQ